jgi:hypothetical protein
VNYAESTAKDGLDPDIVELLGALDSDESADVVSQMLCATPLSEYEGFVTSSQKSTSAATANNQRCQAEEKAETECDDDAEWIDESAFSGRTRRPPVASPVVACSLGEEEEEVSVAEARTKLARKEKLVRRRKPPRREEKQERERGLACWESAEQRANVDLAFVSPPRRSLHPITSHTLSVPHTPSQHGVLHVSRSTVECGEPGSDGGSSLECSPVFDLRTPCSQTEQSPGQVEDVGVTPALPVGPLAIVGTSSAATTSSTAADASSPSPTTSSTSPRCSTATDASLSSTTASTPPRSSSAKATPPPRPPPSPLPGSSTIATLRRTASGRSGSGQIRVLADPPQPPHAVQRSHTGTLPPVKATPTSASAERSHGKCGAGSASLDRPREKARCAPVRTGALGSSLSRKRKALSASTAPAAGSPVRSATAAFSSARTLGALSGVRRRRVGLSKRERVAPLLRSARRT